MIVRRFPLVRTRRLSGLARDECGAAAVTVAVLLTVTMGFVGLGVDVGHSYLTRRSLQNAADSAAFSAATSLAARETTVEAAAHAIAANYGFTNGENEVSVIVNTPPSSGPNAGLPWAVEVLLARPGQKFFSGLFLSETSMVRARAVAHVSPAANACVMALNSTAEASSLQTGSADITLDGCSLFSNSNSSSALTLKGSATLTAPSAGVVGGYDADSSNLGATPVLTGQRPIEDPYADMPAPSYNESACHPSSGGSLPSGTYGDGSTPMVFCGGLQINSGAEVVLNPGIYVIAGGTFQVNGGASLTGTGVTLFFTEGAVPDDYATIRINGGAVIDLTAPTSGPTAGVVLYQDRNAPAGGDNRLNGGSEQKFGGAVYFPSQTINFNGGSETTSGASGGCTQLIASQLAFSGNSNLSFDCDGMPIRRPRAVYLVE
ncbi:pilus assembly protein TadG-related protein [Altericroceibacterium xinjiangense]|uniref:pilus assembly protein TadG-related protein n=1 Tax=Altericroceibacterium xinjiangense TaxID=762261 RepID=UPI000F7F2E0C|nr:pilus assembly protein TadG-related protein [Altericroceibacterium xinjiangense]